MTSKHMKRFSTLVIREMQMKTTMKYHFIPIGITSIKKTSIDEDADRLEHWRDCKAVQLLRNSLAAAQKVQVST